ncbi:helix-turn-helix domain-containing protein [Fibrivirga algicola]|uniref:Helix-turn-helix transcriptional regulator n=1 Tax=Fibrivirga algicola TaxID=2950420 RepID=A0ABX0QTB6_9BACT|nr:helix-turn-helix transcriptional regulator [Fibrivirga algicola]
METLPAKLCLLRQAVGLSQYQIAFFLNVSQPTYCRWEMGETQPRWRNLQTIASFYQLSLPAFLAAESNELAFQVFYNKSNKSLA